MPGQIGCNLPDSGHWAIRLRGNEPLAGPLPASNTAQNPSSLFEQKNNRLFPTFLHELSDPPRWSITRIIWRINTARANTPVDIEPTSRQHPYKVGLPDSALMNSKNVLVRFGVFVSLASYIS